MSLTIEQFRNDPVRVDEWAKVLALPITQEVLAILRDEGPEFDPVIGTTENDSSVLLGLTKGYAKHHRRFEEMAERWPLRRAEPEALYSREEEET